MTKSKKFWAASALVSLAVMAFSGYAVYERMSLHFSGDTIEVRPVPVPAPQEEDTAAGAAADKEDKKEDLKASGETAAPDKDSRAPERTAAESARTKALKTVFEYKDAGARSVMIAGSFTSWKDRKMTKKNGVWKAEIYILPGTYPYHFTVDGKKRLDPDKPKAPTGDSLISVN